MILLYIFALIVNAIAAILTGCSCYTFFQEGNTTKALLEALLCLMNICFFIMNCCNMKNHYDGY